MDAEIMVRIPRLVERHDLSAYAWVFRTVVEDREALRGILPEHGLRLSGFDSDSIG